MQLRDSIPIARMSSIFNDVREHVVATDIAGLAMSREKDIPSLCLFVWDEMVHRNLVSDPYEIAPFTNPPFKGIYRFVQNKLKRKIVSDVFAASYYNEIDANMSFSDVTIVQCFPNDIHIADVEFSDNRQPLTGKKAIKGVRSFKGLHVFGDFIDELKLVATSRNVERISLMIADPALFNVFNKYGFEVSNTKMAQIAFKQVGVGYPMILSV